MQRRCLMNFIRNCNDTAGSGSRPHGPNNRKLERLFCRNALILHHADPLIGKGGVRPGQVNLLHVTNHAPGVANRTWWSRANRRCGTDSVTYQTLRVVETNIVFQPIMRIVTSNATDSLVAFVSRTVKDSIRLISNVINAVLPRQV